MLLSAAVGNDTRWAPSVAISVLTPQRVLVHLQEQQIRGGSQGDDFLPCAHRAVVHTHMVCVHTLIVLAAAQQT